MFQRGEHGAKGDPLPAHQHLKGSYESDGHKPFFVVLAIEQRTGATNCELGTSGQLLGNASGQGG